MYSPEISIIVPTYNVEEYLDKCLTSILNQSVEKSKYEIILIDDGSEDSTYEIAENFAEKHLGIIKIFHKKHSGVADSRNLGLEKAKGKFIFFVDSDDFLDPDMIHKMYNKAIEDSADVVICGYKKIYLRDDGSINQGKIIEVHYDNPELFNKNAKQNPAVLCTIKPYLWNKMYKKHLFEDIKFPSGKTFEDDAVIYGIIYRADKISVIDEPLYNYIIQREGSITGSLNQSIFDIFDACDFLQKFFLDNGIYDDYYMEIEYLCTHHIFARLNVIKKNKTNLLSIDFLDSAFKYLNNKFPKWKDNKYYIDKYYV